MYNRIEQRHQLVRRYIALLKTPKRRLEALIEKRHQLVRKHIAYLDAQKRNLEAYGELLMGDQAHHNNIRVAAITTAISTAHEELANLSQRVDSGNTPDPETELTPQQDTRRRPATQRRPLPFTPAQRPAH